MKLTVLTAKQSTSVNRKQSIKSRSDEQKRPVRNCDCEKNEIAKRCWEADQL